MAFVITTIVSAFIRDYLFEDRTRNYKHYSYFNLFAMIIFYSGILKMRGWMDFDFQNANWTVDFNIIRRRVFFFLRLSPSLSAILSFFFSTPLVSNLRSDRRLRATVIYRRDSFTIHCALPPHRRRRFGERPYDDDDNNNNKRVGRK